MSSRVRNDLGRQQEELEAEVRGQLKRQTEAHSEHVTDALTKQGHELDAQWQMRLYDEISKERDRNMQDIAAVKGRLQGLQVRDRNMQDIAAVKGKLKELGYFTLIH